MSRISNFLIDYWYMMRSRNRVATGIIAIFFFLAGITYMRAFDWTMEVTS